MAMDRARSAVQVVSAAESWEASLIVQSVRWHISHEFDFVFTWLERRLIFRCFCAHLVFGICIYDEVRSVKGIWM
jgi:hypothetical protein